MAIENRQDFEVRLEEIRNYITSLGFQISTKLQPNASDEVKSEIGEMSRDLRYTQQDLKILSLQIDDLTDGYELIRRAYFDRRTH